MSAIAKPQAVAVAGFVSMVQESSGQVVGPDDSPTQRVGPGLGGAHDMVPRGLPAVRTPSAFESCRAYHVPARWNVRIGGLLLVLAVAACATWSPVEPLPFHPPSAEDPRDLALHIIEVNPDGKGDKINRKDILSIQQGNAKGTESNMP